jgi:hypothetical protein
VRIQEQVAVRIDHTNAHSRLLRSVSQNGAMAFIVEGDIVPQLVLEQGTDQRCLIVHVAL